MPQFLTPKWALAVLFLIDGIGFGTWAGHIAVFKQALSISNGQLTIVLVAVVLGSIVSMPLAGQLAAVRGSRWMCVASMLVYLLSILLLSRSASLLLLVCFGFLFGVTKGAVDIAINTQAISLEQPGRRSDMSFLQGCWSVGGLTGSALASVLLRHGGTVPRDLLISTVLLTFLAALSLPALGHGVAAAPRERFQRPGRNLLLIGLLAFAGLMAEGSISDWTSVYLHANLHLSLSLAAAGFSVYAVAMAGMRFTGDWLAERLSGKRLLFLSGSLIASGMAILLLCRSPWMAVVGLVLAGMGTANVVPVLWTVAGRDAIGAGPAISIVATIGYFGFLSGPPLIGSLASVAGLGHALWVLVAAGVMLALSPLLLRSVAWQAAPQIPQEGQIAGV